MFHFFRIQSTKRAYWSVQSPPSFGLNCGAVTILFDSVDLFVGLRYCRYGIGGPGVVSWIDPFWKLKYHSSFFLSVRPKVLFMGKAYRHWLLGSLCL